MFVRSRVSFFVDLVSKVADTINADCEILFSDFRIGGEKFFEQLQGRVNPNASGS